MLPATPSREALSPGYDDQPRPVGDQRSTIGDQPEYACALITDRRGWLVLQLRPATARRAAGLITCFGGRREDGEGIEKCLRRELVEELAWTPADCSFACDLRQGRRHVARFFAMAIAVPLGDLRTEPGDIAIAAPWAALPGLPISPWHALALSAIAAGRDAVELPM